MKDISRKGSKTPSGYESNSRLLEMMEPPITYPGGYGMSEDPPAVSSDYNLDLGNIFSRLNASLGTSTIAGHEVPNVALLGLAYLLFIRK